MTYKPRRSGKKWREDCPDYVLDILDNKGKTADRYTVLFTFPVACTVDPKTGDISNRPGKFGETYIPYLGTSANPASPQGVGMWGEMKAHQAANYRDRCKRHRIKWLDLPEQVRQHVIERLGG